MAENRHKSLGLSDEQVLDMFRTMLLARRIDERMWLLNRAGKIPFVISCQGQEAAQVGASYALDRDKDYVLPYYRDMGVVLAFGMTARDLMLSGFAKAEDPNSGGRQMPGHFGQKKNRIVTGSSPVTTQVPHAVGIALAGKMEKRTSYLSLPLERALPIRGISTKERTLQVSISCRLFSWLKTINMLFLFQCPNSWPVKRSLIVPSDTGCRGTQWTGTIRWLYMKQLRQLPTEAEAEKDRH